MWNEFNSKTLYNKFTKSYDFSAPVKKLKEMFLKTLRTVYLSQNLLDLLQHALVLRTSIYIVFSLLPNKLKQGYFYNKLWKYFIKFYLKKQTLTPKIMFVKKM